MCMATIIVASILSRGLRCGHFLPIPLGTSTTARVPSSVGAESELRLAQKFVGHQCEE